MLFITGVAWWVADALKESPNGDLWQTIAANLLMLHGGAAMVTLMLLGALIPLHLQRAWRSGRNRTAGAVMIAFNAVLIVTAFGLYYLGAETVRPWFSNVHLAIGLFMPAMFLAHIWLGRRTP